MVVCKFFLQGNCRYGNKCKFEHSINTDTSEVGKSIMRPRTATPGSVDIAMLIKSVQTDMLNCEKGGQWPLSSYAPFKEKANFPGFEDQSFEEVRLGFYTATTAGTLNQYKQLLESSLQTAICNMRALQTPNEHVVQTLHKIYTTPVYHGQPYSQAPFGAAPFPPTNSSFAPSPFGGTSATASKSVFGGAPTSNSPFASTSIFGGSTQPTTGNIFGGGGPIFAPTPPATVAAPTGSIFAQAAKNFQPSQIQPQQAPSIFGQPPTASTNVFGQAAQNVFATRAPTAPTQNVAVSAFGKTQGLLSNAQTSNFPVGTNTQTTNNIFVQNQPTSQHSIFGLAPPSKSKSACYADATLSTELQNIYTAERFKFGQIPITPPTADLSC